MLAVAAFVVVGAGCGGAGGSANQAATATTFTIDTATADGMKSIVDQANTAALLSTSGRGGTALAACTSAWNRVRANVATRDVRTARTLDGALASLGQAVQARNSTAAVDAAATIATAAARYTRLYP